MNETAKIIFNRKKHLYVAVFSKKFLDDNDLRMNDSFQIEVIAEKIILTRSVPISVLRREKNKFIRRIKRYGHHYVVTRSTEVIGKLTKNDVLTCSSQEPKKFKTMIDKLENAGLFILVNEHKNQVSAPVD